MNKDEFIKEIEKLNIDYNDDMLQKLDIYLNFLKDYNCHTNLTAIKEEKDIYLKHFYDSLTICKSHDMKYVNNLIDIGSGAGFPGMVIKIFFPSIEITLLDSNNKKTKFLEELSNKLNVHVNIINDRVENYSKNNLNKFDIVTSRAVANLRVLTELSLPIVKENGLFIALKGNIDDELEVARETIELMTGKIIKIINFKLFNDAGKRSILVIKKTRETKASHLRTYDQILKRPLKNNNK